MRTNLIEKKSAPKKVLSTTDGKLDMVIAFDTTGSMSSYIGDVKQHVTELIPKLLDANPKMRIGIVAFGDYCDMNSKDNFGKAYQVLPLTSNKQRIMDFVINAENTGGGDGDEFYELVIKKITEETDWRKDAQKAVLLIADAEPHYVGYTYGSIVHDSQIDWKEEAKKTAELGIKWDTMKIHPDLKWMEELSAMTNGINVPFKSSNKTSAMIEAASYARGGSATLDMFTTSCCMAKASGDAELTAVYAAYSKELVDDTVNTSTSTITTTTLKTDKK